MRTRKSAIAEFIVLMGISSLIFIVMLNLTLNSVNKLKYEVGVLDGTIEQIEVIENELSSDNYIEMEKDIEDEINNIDKDNDKYITSIIKSMNENSKSLREGLNLD